MANKAVIDSEFLCLFQEINLAASVPDDTISPALRCIQAASNAMNVDIQVDKDCPDKIIQLKYQVPLGCGEVEVPCGEPLACDTECCPTLGETNTLSFGYGDLPEFDCVTGSITFDPAEYNCSCEEPSAVYQQLLRDEARRMIRQYKQKLYCLVYDQAGNYSLDGNGQGNDSSTDPFCIPLWSASAPTRPQPLALTAINNEYDNQNNTGTIYALTGGNKVNTFLNSQGCFDIQNCPSDINWCYDRTIQKALSKNYATGKSPATSPILTFTSGAFKILETYQYESPLIACNAHERNSYVPTFSDNGIVMQKLDIGSSLFGFPFVVDALIETEKCSKKFRIKMRKQFALWCPPKEMYCPEDQYGCSLLWDVCCSDIGCDFFCD